MTVPFDRTYYDASSFKVKFRKINFGVETNKINTGQVEEATNPRFNRVFNKINKTSQTRQPKGEISSENSNLLSRSRNALVSCKLVGCPYI
jgi:hypothetical protein